MYISVNHIYPECFTFIASYMKKPLHKFVSPVQVRVHVIEARKLQGGGLNPVVKVACGQQIKGTSSRKGTNNPFFDEVIQNMVIVEIMLTRCYIDKGINYVIVTQYYIITLHQSEMNILHVCGRWVPCTNMLHLIKQ